MFKRKLYLGGLLSAFMILISISVISTAFAGTYTILSGNREGGFEFGDTFGANGWTVVNGTQTNVWTLGTGAPKLGMRGAYISSPLQQFFYNPDSASVVHFHRLFSVPDSAKEVYLQFGFNGNGIPPEDIFEIFVVPPSTPIAAGVRLTFGRVTGGLRYDKIFGLLGHTVNLTYYVVPGNAYRLVVSWVNDGDGQGKQPPTAIDAISLSYTTRNPLKDRFSWQNPVPHGNDHTGILPTAAGTAIITGHAGTVGRTTDSGQTWDFSYVINGIRSALVSPVVSGNDIYAVAQPNWFLRSINLGVDWQVESQINTDNTPVNAIAARGQNVVAVGNVGSVYRSTDGGVTWGQFTSGVLQDLLTVTYEFGTTNKVTAAGVGGTVIQSSDGGENWATTGSGIPFFQIQDIKSFNLNKYIAATIGSGLYLSTDGANNFTQVSGTQGMSINGIAIKDTMKGAAVGGLGIVIDTNNGWNSISIGITDPEDFHQAAAFYPNSDDVSIAGTSGSLHHSPNNLATINRVSSGITNNLNDLFYLPLIISDRGPSLNTLSHFPNGWVAGNAGTVLKTTDGGNNWIPLSTGVLGNLQGITANGDGLVMAVGSAGQHIRSTDDGTSWSTMNIPLSVGLSDIHLIKPRKAIAVGGSGSVVITADGGQSWTQQSSGVSAFLNGVDVVTETPADTAVTDSFNAIAVGNFGTIIQTTDGGNSWLVRSSPTNANLQSVNMVDSLVGYAVGVGGVVLRTTDGGETWGSYTAGFPQTLTSVSFIAPDIGVAATREGMLLRTVDGAVTWDTLASPTANELNGVIMFDSYSATAVGESGTIIHAEPDTVMVVTDIGESHPRGGLPSRFVLEPNYPNPFNPNTTIAFALPQQSDVRLAVYNIIGQKVRTLVNNRLEAGYHRVVWDGRNDAGLPVGSGVYLYHMVAGDHSQVRKMILMK